MRPLLARGRLVTVDGHRICAVCGDPVLPLADRAWGHLPAGRPYPRGSRWFAPVTWAELRDLRSYQEITEAHAKGMAKLVTAFETLYDVMPPEQKKIADAVFAMAMHPHAAHPKAKAR